MACFIFLTLTIEGANSNTTFFICFLVYRYSSVVGDGGEIPVDLTTPGAGRDWASQSCSGPRGSSPTLVTPYQRQGQDNEVCQGCPCSLIGACGYILLPISSICFTTSPLPTPTLYPFPFSWAMCPFGRKKLTP